MGIFNKIFGDSEHKDTRETLVSWKMLTDINQLQEIVEESKSHPVVLFKHSTRCSISRMALKQFENHYPLKADEADLYFLDLLEYRPISNAIADMFKVVHQSPQLLLIVNGECIYTTSHSEIDADELAKKIKSV